MRNMKKLNALLLVCAAVFMLCSCQKAPDLVPEGTYILKNESSVKREAPAEPLDPAAVYAGLTYIPEMFYGTYIAAAEPEEEETSTVATTEGFFPEEALEEDADEAADIEYITLKNGPGQAVNALPCGMHTESTAVSAEAKIYPMTLTFKTADGMPAAIDCAFFIDGKKLICKPVYSFGYDGSNHIVGCSYTGDELVYEFGFSGPYLTLTRNEQSVTLVSEMFSKDPPSFFLSCYSSSEHDETELLRHIEFSWSGDASTRITLTDRDKNVYGSAAASISKDGLFTVTIPAGKERLTLQYVYFYAASDCLVLTDGEKVYCFNGSWFDEYLKNLADNLSAGDFEKLKGMSEEEIEAVIAKKKELIADISDSFAAVGINVDINNATGEIAMDSSVLFGGDSSDITEKGKELLNKVVKAYSSVIFDEKYRDFVAGITVAGHTAPIDGSSYEADLPLSKQRAVNVKDYCISPAAGLDEKNRELLSSAMRAVGMSNSRPVYGADGKVDFAASRRVTFHISLNIAGIVKAETPSDAPKK